MENSSEKILIILVGPTASGKSAFAVDLGLRYGAEIVNADSRQVYQELEIGVAKPSAQELASIPHHLVSTVSIHAPYSAGQWARDARAAVHDAFERATPQAASGRRFCILAGGSGLHIRALVDGIPPMPEVDPRIRDAWQERFDRHGLAPLQQALQARDPAYYAQVDRSNPHRLIRALSVMEVSDQTFSALRAAPRNPLPYPVRWIILDPPRERLYARIEQRVDDMIEAGLEHEARELYPYRQLNALQTIGYREWWPYFEGEYDLKSAIALIKQNTRRYAKRQLTWNRKLDGLRLNEPTLSPVQKYINQLL